MDDDTLLCGCLCMAARHLGFKLSKIESDGSTTFAWVDLMNGMAATVGPTEDDPKKALIGACRMLQEKLSLFPQ